MPNGRGVYTAWIHLTKGSFTSWWDGADKGTPVNVHLDGEGFTSSNPLLPAENVNPVFLGVPKGAENMDFDV